MDGAYIEAPYYTRPADFKGMKVPDVLLSGNEKKIKDWKNKQSKIMTENWKNINSTE
jgi:tRNA (guanine37-N1)-methyltransferase